MFLRFGAAERSISLTLLRYSKYKFVRIDITRTQQAAIVDSFGFLRDVYSMIVDQQLSSTMALSLAQRKQVRYGEDSNQRHKPP